MISWMISVSSFVPCVFLSRTIKEPAAVRYSVSRLKRSSMWTWIPSTVEPWRPADLAPCLSLKSLLKWEDLVPLVGHQTSPTAVVSWPVLCCVASKLPGSVFHRFSELQSSLILVISIDDNLYFLLLSLYSCSSSPQAKAQAGCSLVITGNSSALAGQPDNSQEVASKHLCFVQDPPPAQCLLTQGKRVTTRWVWTAWNTPTQKA